MDFNTIIKIYELAVAKLNNYKKYINVLKISVSIVFIFFILKKINFSEIIPIFYNININLLFYVILSTFIFSLLFVFKTYLILNKFVNKSFIKHYFINRVGNFFNMFLLGNFGMEVSRLMYFKNIPKKKTIFLSLFDRIIGFWAIITIFLFSIKELSYLLNIPLLLFSIILIFSFIILSVFIFWYSFRLGFSFKKILLLFLVSLLYHIGLIFLAVLKFNTIGVFIPFSKLCYIIPLLSILTMLPLSIDGIGISEYFLISVLTLSPENIIIYSILGRIINIILSLPGLLYFLIKIKN